MPQSRDGILAPTLEPARRAAAHWPPNKNSPTSSKSVEKRAFKRSVYHVRDEEAALDIVQDSMMKLAEHYGDKPADELPMLFQRILSNCTLDWFRRQKTRNALLSEHLATSNRPATTAISTCWKAWKPPTAARASESAEDSAPRAQILRDIERGDRARCRAVNAKRF